MIELKNIEYGYGNHIVLKNVNFMTKQGSVLVLLGPSGAGKSSLLRIMNLLEIPKVGQLSVAGFEFDFTHKIPDADIRALRQKVGMVFQQYHLWPHKSVMDNLIYAPTQLGKMSKADATVQADKMLDRLKLSGLGDRYPLKLSGGQQQRVAIARALMMSPEVLLFDEPTAALDPEITSQVAEIINELSTTGITQVVVTHDVDFAKKIATDIVYLENGQIVEMGGCEHFDHPETVQFKEYLSH